jgi:hypothetical protein
MTRRTTRPAKGLVPALRRRAPQMECLVARRQLLIATARGVFNGAVASGHGWSLRDLCNPSRAVVPGAMQASPIDKDTRLDPRGEVAHGRTKLTALPRVQRDALRLMSVMQCLGEERAPSLGVDRC